MVREQWCYNKGFFLCVCGETVANAARRTWPAFVGDTYVCVCVFWHCERWVDLTYCLINLTL